MSSVLNVATPAHQNHYSIKTRLGASLRAWLTFTQPLSLHKGKECVQLTSAQFKATVAKTERKMQIYTIFCSLTQNKVRLSRIYGSGGKLKKICGHMTQLLTCGRNACIYCLWRLRIRGCWCWLNGSLRSIVLEYWGAKIQGHCRLDNWTTGHIWWGIGRLINWWWTWL